MLSPYYYSKRVFCLFLYKDTYYTTTLKRNKKQRVETKELPSKLHVMFAFVAVFSFYSFKSGIILKAFEFSKGQIKVKQIPKNKTRNNEV